MSVQEISAAEEMMKMAINNQNHVDSLIGYYRDLIDSYNNQRAQWVLHYDNVNTTAGDQYLLEKQLGHAKAQLQDLHQQLALKKAELTAERQKYFKNLETNGIMKKRLEQSKANYRELMNTCKPVGLNNKQFSNSSILGASKHQSSKLSVMRQNLDSKSTQLELQLINTNKQHEQKKAKLKIQIDGLKSQLNGLIRQFEDREQANRSQYENSLNRLSDLQSKYMTLTSQYFRFRTTNATQQKKSQQQNQILRLKNLSLVQKLKNLQKQHSQEFHSVDNEVKKQNKKFKSKYDEQLRKKEEHLTILKQQHERIQDIYLNKIKKMEEQLRTINDKLKVTEDKTKVQVNSLKSQIRILKGRLQKQGLHEMRKEIANDEDESSQSLQISDLQKINQEVKNLEKQLNTHK